MVGTRDLGMPSVQGRRSAGGTGLPAGDIGLSAGDIDTGLGAGKCQGRHCQGHSWREGSWVRPQRRNHKSIIDASGLGDEGDGKKSDPVGEKDKPAEPSKGLERLVLPAEALTGGWN